ncbi:MAG: arginine N-succinyltransferase [Pseudomonadota bacterium]
MADLVMRPACSGDLAALMELAELSGPGFTSLPVNEPLLSERLRRSEAAFAGDVDAPTSGKFLLMMEDVGTGAVVGCSAVKAGIGLKQPFFNYRIITVTQASQIAGRRTDMDALVLTNEFQGYTEVGTLFVKANSRGGGAGRLAAQCRYLLMAAAPERFNTHVLSELRGVVDGAGIAPFWECLGRHFFRMDFDEADFLSATRGNQFILDLMPKYPIYVDLLPAEGREVIGRVHADGVGALKLLEWEGFEFERVVDVFDGGPLVSARRDRIRTIQESAVVTLVAGDSDKDGEGDGIQGLASNDVLPDFRTTLARFSAAGEGAYRVDPGVLERLKLKSGARARIWMRSG